MRAVVYHGPGQVGVEDVAVPRPGPGDLLLRVSTAGVCGTDAGEYARAPMFFPIERPHAHSGHFGPTIPGHEFSGRVLEVGADVDGFAAGDLVAVGAGVSCGTCPPCLAGHTNMCETYWTVGLHANGGLAEVAKVPASCTLNLSGTAIAPDLAALVQPMAIAVHATRRGRLSGEDRVVVLGAGGIGTFITFAAARSGAEVTAVDIDAGRLEVAARLGATRSVNLSTMGEEAIPANPSVVFECTARPESLLRALRLLAENGRLVVVGHQSQPVTVDFKPISMGEREVIGTMAHAFRPDFPRAADLVASDPGAWTELAPFVYPLDQVVASALEPMSSGQAPQIKMLFDPSIDHRRPLDTSP